MVAQLNASVRTVALSGVRQRHPQANEAEIQRRLADILLGSELASDVYGPIITTTPEQTANYASAEDTILAKLDWYRQGSESADRQWRDILGIVQTQGKQLDWGYLKRTAVELSVRDLLDRLIPSLPTA